KGPLVAPGTGGVFRPAGERAREGGGPSACSGVVPPADIHEGTASPFSCASWSAITLSRGIAEAGTAGPGTATADRSPVNRALPQPAIIRPASIAAMHGSVTIFHVSPAMAHLAHSISPVRWTVYTACRRHDVPE